jgi:hypothetical protein
MVTLWSHTLERGWLTKMPPETSEFLDELRMSRQILLAKVVGTGKA